MNELLPCPFCGGKPKLAKFGLVYCADCGATIPALGADRAVIIENWNARIKAQEIVLDTTGISNVFSLSDTLSLQGETYRRERTCRQVDVTDKYQPYVTHMTACSFCGEILAVEEYPAPNYCSNCGAKVVD